MFEDLENRNNNDINGIIKRVFVGKEREWNLKLCK